jgi:hypothetical protein
MAFLLSADPSCHVWPPNLKTDLLLLQEYDEGGRIKKNFNFLLFVYIICCTFLCKCIFLGTHSFLFSPLCMPSLFACILHWSKHFLLPMIALFSMFVPYYTFPFAMLVYLNCCAILSRYCFHSNFHPSFAFRSNLSTCCLHRAAAVYSVDSRVTKWFQ